MSGAASEEIHVKSLLIAFGCAGLISGLSYLTPTLHAYRPWEPGEPIPIFSSLILGQGAKVMEDERAGLVGVDPGTGLGGDAAVGAGEEGAEVGEEGAAEGEAEGAEVGEDAEAGAAEGEAGAEAGAAAGGGAGGAEAVRRMLPVVTAGVKLLPPEAEALLSPQEPTAPVKYRAGQAQPLEDEGYRGMARYYRALRAAGEGKGVARALHYGDSTIAGDGIAKTVRARLQRRFGNAGPGFVSAGMDPRWNKRSDVEVSKGGSWSTKSILHGGGGGRYGLGGIVATGQSGSTVSLRAIVQGGGANKTTVPIRRLEIWYQSGPGYGSLRVEADDQEVLTQAAGAAAVAEQRAGCESETGFNRLKIGVAGGAVPLYGVVLETGRAGATWEALGVIGVGSRSFTAFKQEHLSLQVAARDPDLITIQLGGNEAGYPLLKSGDGSGYIPYYRKALDAIRAGAPEASCLVLTPLDQGTRDEGGQAVSKPAIPRMVNAQRQAAAAAGCGFWSAFDAMGGSGSIVRWGATKPTLAWADLLHLSGPGLEIIGNLLSDALLADYDAWLASGGA